jgi:hypothetical protein
MISSTPDLAMRIIYSAVCSVTSGRERASKYKRPPRGKWGSIFSGISVAPVAEVFRIKRLPGRIMAMVKINDLVIIRRECNFSAIIIFIPFKPIDNKIIAHPANSVKIIQG